MKKIFLGTFIVISFTSLLAFTAISYQIKKSTADVDQIQGLYIFVDSKPVMDYEYLGTVKSTVSLGDGQYTGVRDRIIKKAKKDYPEADGIIITFKTGGTDKGDAIKFK
jgi:hypothetical protein